MSTIEVGQVLSLKIRYNNSGLTSNVKHPYLVVDVDDTLDVVEIAQVDSLAGKEYKAARRSNKVLYYNDPVETVIDRDSYIQMDNRFRVENCPELEGFRRQTDKLSHEKLQDVLRAYRRYQDSYDIDDDKNVYMTKAEILSLNR